MQKGPNDQLDEIENLLVKWIEKNQDNQAVEALVALTCARDSFDTIIRTVHVLVNLKGGHSQFTLTKICLFFSPSKDSFLRALREGAPEMEIFLENHGQYMKTFVIE